MAQITEGTTEHVKAVRFSFFTDEEVREHSVVKVTNPILLDSMERPVPGGLYDPELGPLDERSLCKKCGQRSFHCPGHCGNIDLVSPAYNPLLFNILYNLLQRTCLFCHHFRASRSQVETCISQLKLIVEGDVVGAKRLDSDTPGETSYPNDGDWSQNHDAKYLRQQGWTSLQFMEAMSVLKKFLRPRFVVCKNCGAKNPKISKPTFGWFHMSGMSGADARRNAIRGCKLGRSSTGGTNGKSLPEVENTDDITNWGDVVDIVETDPSSVTSPRTQDSATRKQRKKAGEVLLDFVKQKDFFSGPLLPSEVKEIVKLLWENESQLCSFISDIQHQGFKMKDNEPKTDYSMFFLETILVPPIKFRPPSKGGDSVMEHPQTVLLGKVLQSNISLGNAHVNNLERSKIVSRWMDLQQSINMLFDSKTATGQGQRNVASGICQLLEKKEGMFRQKMMGKRVNFACRSVISPDPYLAVNEIGIPPYFALRLTYPERVTPWNVVKLRNAIINGSDIHPGATQYGDKLDTKQLPPSRKGRIAISRKLPSSRGLLTQHGKSCDYEFEGKFVRRHLQDGDIVLVNRQPTLHKPSIMAHVVRVLKGEKTLRMHYANCSTYNADFDGDEMNVHFPQDEISRAEAYNIVNANNQYVKPTSGEPIRALIQDHVVSAVLLTKKDTFFTGDEFNQLLYCAGISTARPVSFLGKFGQKVCMLNSEDEMQPLLPAIWKPVPLWTGKQVISALLNHITKGHPPFTVEKDAKLPRDFFRSGNDEDELNKQEKVDKKGTKEGVLDDKKLSKGKMVDGNASKKKEPDEDKLLIYKNDLVRGVIDKAQFGEYGLVHTVQELYGSNTAGILLSALSRLFTAFLQVHGFTCGVDDLLLMKKKDDDRDKNLQDCEKVGEEVHRMFVSDKGGDKIDLLQLKIEEKIRGNGEPALTDLDRKMISKLNEELSKNFFKELLSRGLLKPSGKNCISLMTTSGAKGASVNFQQISSHLGQQELEGKRVPRMVSGKTLPCFPPWDWAARAGGFIIDRFLTGLHPQEYYFHCMAGREGLVDTAVKTSRSGYLQRCLIKNLECLKICYDHTVRDADGSIIQFCYGEDGVDVHQTSYIAKFEALAANKEMIFKKCGQELQKSNSYIKELPCALEEKAKEFVRAFSLRQKNPNVLKEADFLKLMEHKYVLSLAQPGEPVGVLAAQSVGEPSTQMTLNTFHLAGRGEMNVTLGIPRLQEILMTASSDIKTPVMTCPFQIGRSKEDASCLADKLKKITVADIIKNMKVSVIPFSVHDHQTCSIYKLEMMLHIPENYPKHTDITLEDWEGTLEVVFVRELEDAIQNHLLLLSKISGIENFTPDSESNASNGTEDDDVSGNKSHREEENDDDNDADDGGVSEDLGMDAQKRKQQATDEMDYGDSSEEEPDEGELSAGSESEIDRLEDEIEVSNDAVIGRVNVKDVTSEPSELGKPSKHKLKDKRNQSETKRKKRARGKLVKKEYDRAFFVKTKGMHFEVHFRFTNEPHILLAQIAQKTAKKVYIQSFGKIDGCKVVTCKEKQVIYYGKNPKDRKDISSAEKEKVPALQTTGVDFSTLWQFQDVLDVRYVYSNNIHAMLTTYGVEAARETIIKEIQHVFGSYGISVNMRHLTLIADYMTHSGGYRPMNRLGGIAESTSPFSKMSFETASKFIVEAAYHGETDELETPSARICLGLPVKQQSSVNNYRFGMHDLVNDLARFVSRQFILRLEGSNSLQVTNKTRHLSIVTKSFENMPKTLEALYEAKGLRTFLPIDVWNGILLTKFPHDLLPKLRFLRVLSFKNDINLTELPDSIGNIRHLRYLDLSDTPIRKLPDSICQLCNLQILRLMWCSDLTVLPKDMHKLVSLRHLVLYRTAITEMPLHLGRLKCLQTLGEFVVSKKNSGSSIGELGKLEDIGGELSIRKLQNVKSPMDALDASLKDKKRLKGLELLWDDTTSSISESQLIVLENLQPHTNLNNLFIYNYGGKSFPDWIAHHSFSKMKYLFLYNCKYCHILPAFGQLHSLQWLYITGFHGIARVGKEFYGSGSSMFKPFEALKFLRFKDMPDWENWFCFDECEAFPRLEELEIVKCPKLTGGLPIHLPSLAKLAIAECSQLKSSLPRSPTLRELKLTNFNEVLLNEFPSGLQIVVLEGCAAIRSLPEGMMDFSSPLQRLEIDGCPSLKFLSDDDLPSTLETLKISNCKKLEFAAHFNYSSLKELYLENSCDSLRCFPVNLIAEIDFLTIKGCGNLECLTDSEQHESDLAAWIIRIENCPNFVLFPNPGLRAQKLKRFEIHDCGSLRSLPDKMHLLLPSLESLSICKCPMLQSFGEGGLPTNIKSIFIEDCDILVARRTTWGLQKLPSLRKLSISGKCEDVESFPQPSLLPMTMTSLTISGFSNMKSLDKKGLQQLTFLEKLYILNLPSLKFTPEERTFDSISTLIHLSISGIPTMTSLDYLGLQRLTSLKHMEIYDCPNLKVVPKNGFPASISTLKIHKCPLLEKQLQNKKGKEWHKVAHIPHIEINDQLI